MIGTKSFEAIVNGEQVKLNIPQNLRLIDVFTQLFRFNRGQKKVVGKENVALVQF